jgi:hypothetical protein
MQLMRLAEVPSDRRDRVFYYSRFRAVTGAAALIALAGGALLWGWLNEVWLSHYAGAVLLILLLIFQKLITARFRLSNWLLRMTDHGLFIKFRSYLNNHFDDQDLTVVFIPYSEIRSARSVKERRQVPDQDERNRPGTMAKTRRIVEVELAGDSTPLREALARERQRLFSNSVIGAGGISTRYQHIPVQFANRTLLQIEWGAVPSAQALLDALTRHTLVQTTAANPDGSTREYTARYVRVPRLSTRRPRVPSRQRVCARVDAGTVTGELLVRDGLPLLNLASRGHVDGAVLHFRPEASGRAYYRIVEAEPDKQYGWDTVTARTVADQAITANILVGRDVLSGTVPFENQRWRGRDDPFFQDALKVVAETLPPDDGSPAPSDLRILFRVQMGYLLLWSVLERYAALRYHLAGESAEKVDYIAREPAFIEGLRQYVREPRVMYRAEDPDADKRCRLTPDNPKKALRYYYQVRCNATHRGKGAAQDFRHLVLSSRELLAIATEVVNHAFEEAKWPGYGD